MTNVMVYGTQACPWCHRAADFLKESNVEFEYIDVSSNPVKQQEMVQKSGQMGVPVIDIDGTIIVGFDVIKIKQLLGI